jgi:hypothetical protein
MTMNSGSLETPGQFSSVGVPIACEMRLSWWTSVSPAIYGVRMISSAKTRPTDQISTAPE